MAKFFMAKYNVVRCVYGRAKGKASCDLNLFKMIMNSFCQWFSDRDKIEDTGILVDSIFVEKVVCKEDKYLVVLWQKTSTDNSAYALNVGISPNDDAKTKQSKFSEGYIPGVPLYLYVDAMAGFVYIIKPEGACFTGANRFRDVIKNFMVKHPVGVLLQQTFDMGEGLIARKTEEDVKVPVPHFKLSRSWYKSEKDSLVSLASQVSKLIYTLPARNAKQTSGKALGLKMLTSLGLRIEKNVVPQFKGIKCEIGIDLTPEMMREIIESSQTRSGERVGFRVKNSAKSVVWADTQYDAMTESLDVKFKKGLYSAEGLLDAMIEKTKEA